MVVRHTRGFGAYRGDPKTGGSERGGAAINFSMVRFLVARHTRDVKAHRGASAESREQLRGGGLIYV